MDKSPFYMRNTKTGRSSKLLQWIGVLSLTVVIGLVSCDSKNKGPVAPPPVAVNVYAVQPGNATYFENYPGTATPLNQVDIKPQVSGNIIGIYFKDGQEVRKGQNTTRSISSSIRRRLSRPRPMCLSPRPTWRSRSRMRTGIWSLPSRMRSPSRPWIINWPIWTPPSSSCRRRRPMWPASKPT